LSDAKEEGLFEGEQLGIEKGEKIGIKKGEKIGIKKGEKIGIEKGFYITGLESLRNRLSKEVIEKITHLSKETILKLKQLLEKYGDKAENHLDEIM